MKIPGMPSAPLRQSRTPRWLGVGLALLAGTFTLQAQIHPGPGFNLFGDELVKKLPAQNGVIVIPGESLDRDKGEENAKGFAHALVFHDGSQLRGEIVSLTQDEIGWRRPDVSEPLRFRRSDVRRVVLTAVESSRPRWSRNLRRRQATPDEQSKKTGFATVKLAGSDWLHGALSSADGQNFSIKLGEQTSFTLSREAIAWLHSGAEPAPAFGFSGGPLEMEGWLAHSPGAQMEIKDGTLTVSGADWIGREMATLERFEMSFELPAEAEDFTQVWLQPHGPAVNSYTMGTIEMRLGRRAFNHCIFTSRLDHVPTPLPKATKEETGPVRYRILYDGPGERLVVIRNGQQLGSWPFFDERDKLQNPRFHRAFSISGICFQRRAGRNRPLQLNRVQFLPWDGTLNQDGATTGEGDSLLSSDGKTRAGRLETLSENELQFSGEKLERKPGTFLRFAQEPTPLANIDAMLLFGDQGELGTADLKIQDGKVSFRTTFAAALEAPVATLQTIAFPTRTEPPSPKLSDILVFKNGDEIAGFLVSAAQGEPWRWQTLTGQEISIQPAHIAGFRSFAGSTASTKVANTATVEFRNGDRLRGELTGVREGRVQFRHGQLGDFTLNPAHLWSLYPSPRQSVTDGAQASEIWLGLSEDKGSDPFNFFAPTEPDNSSRWIYFDGRYVMRPEFRSNNHLSNALTAPTGQKPERFELRFDVTSLTGGQPSFNFTLTSNQSWGTLRAQILADSFHAHVYSRKTRNSRAKQASFAGKLQTPTSRRNMRVFVDSQAGTADFFLDGMFLTRMGQQEAERLPGLGSDIQLQPNTYNGPVIFSNIWIGPWNGELPEAEAERVPAASLTNGDVAEALPTGFRDGKVTLETAIGPIDVPLEKLAALEFGGEMSSKPAAARVRLADGTALSVDTFRWEGTQFIGQSEAMGNLQIPAKLITELALAPAPPRVPMMPPAKKTATPEENHAR